MREVEIYLTFVSAFIVSYMLINAVEAAFNHFQEQAYSAGFFNGRLCNAEIGKFKESNILQYPKRNIEREAASASDSDSVIESKD